MIHTCISHPLTQMTHYNQQLNCDNDTHMYITPLTQMTHYNQQLNCDNDTHMYITPLTQMTHYNQQLNCDNDTHMYITPLTQMTHYNQQLNCDNDTHMYITPWHKWLITINNWTVIMIHTCISHPWHKWLITINNWTVIMQLLKTLSLHTHLHYSQCKLAKTVFSMASGFQLKELYSASGNVKEPWKNSTPEIKEK